MQWCRLNRIPDNSLANSRALPACFHRLFVIVLSALLPSAFAAPTPNTSSFADAAGSSLDYRETTVMAVAAGCASLIARSDYSLTILSANLEPPSNSAPEACIVRGVISPEVQFVVHLPTHWNGRLYMHGNGGYAGEPLDDPAGLRARNEAVRNGFAAAFTNTGHDAVSEPGADWGFRNLQKEIDFGFRAVHVTALAAKQLAAGYYGSAPRYSYFDGCSTGGLQGFMAAQRFPEDFDGILAGAPVFNMSSMMWQYRKNQLAIADVPLSREKLQLLGQHVLGRFDAMDGAGDGVIEHPETVDFVPSRDLPRAQSGRAGFTDRELAMLDLIYAPTVAEDREIYPRMVVGGEFPGQAYIEGTDQPAPDQSAWEGRLAPDGQGRLGQPELLEMWFRNLAFEQDDRQRDWRQLDPAEHFTATRQAARIFDAVDPDLESFRRRGGRMIVYHGWADAGVNPLRTVEYFRQVEQRSGSRTGEFLQLYMIPGMQHCRGGSNVDRFDLMTPLINWVEGGTTPAGLAGRRVVNGETVRVRPLCPYPQVSRYAGTGSVEEIGNFRCEAPQE